MGINPATHKVYLPNSDSGTVTVVDASNIEALTTSSVNVGVGPNSAAVNPATNKVYIGNLVDKTISVLDG